MHNNSQFIGEIAKPQNGFPPISILGKETLQNQNESGQALCGIGRLVHPFSGAAVKAGCEPVHFSLDGCTLSRYFSGSAATTSGLFVHKLEHGTKDGAFIYLPPFFKNSPAFRSFPFAKVQPVFLPEQTGRTKHRTPFPPSATPAGITHYTLQAKSCAKWGRCPLWKPPQEKAVRYPSTGRIPPFLFIQPFGCIG